MIYGFETNNENLALSSLLVYAVFKSRDTSKFKVTPDMWGIIERQVKASAKRSITILDFLENFKKKLKTSSIQPRFMNYDNKKEKLTIELEDGTLVEREEKRKNYFWTNEIENADNKAVLNELYNHTNFVILLVREKLEIEKKLKIADELGEEI
jgi:hypothetical protein|nr:MAG TPA: hypothetical protein [Caudoviricetes sp.]